MTTEVIALLLGVGGTGGLAGLVQVYLTARRGKLENEETLIRRLNEDSRQQGQRADRAEQSADRWRTRANQALDIAWQWRRIALSHGAAVDEGPPVETRDA